MSWIDCIRTSLSVVERKAGKQTIAALAELLAQRRSHDVDIEVQTVLEALNSVAEQLRDHNAGMEQRQAVLATITESTIRTEYLRDRLTSREDIRALSRWMDEEAVQDRQLLTRHRFQQQLTFLTKVAAKRLMSCNESIPEALTRLTARRMVDALRNHQQPWHARSEAAQLLGQLIQWDTERLVSHRQALREVALDVQDEPWVQVAALEAYVALLPEDEAAQVLSSILLPGKGARARPPEHAFVRARVAGMCAQRELHTILVRCLQGDESSEHVRIQVMQALAVVETDPKALEWLTVQPGDPSDRVCAAGLIAILPQSHTPGRPQWWAVIGKALGRVNRPVLLHIVVDALLERRHFLAQNVEEWKVLREAWEEPLQHLMHVPGHADMVDVCGHLHRWLAVHSDPWLFTASNKIHATIAGIKPGHSRRLEDGLSSLSSGEMLQILAVAALDDHDLSASRGSRRWRVYRGIQSKPALWRLLHEVRTPAPDKRQSHSHIVDQIPQGQLIAPAMRLSEVTATRVPGQRRSSPEGLSWGGHLPMPATLMSAARHGEVRVATPYGVALVESQSRWFGGLKGQLQYVQIARQREDILRRHSDRRRAAEEYDRMLSKRGFQVTRMGGILPPEVYLLLLDMIRTDGNSMLDVGVLSGVLLTGWLGRTMWSSRQIRRYRNRVPLVIGGWGSRGKSGTERLKAAMFHGLGYQVLSKTTGCEAMVLLGIPGAPMEEIPLFRPYDKASIWEQEKVLQLADRQQVQVMLWECMALKGRYVDIMQRHWMRDEYATVTNTYPDHEDVQGPTGQDVTRVIGRFIPDRAMAFSTEQHMSPLLDDAAHAKGTHLQRCRPEEWGLLPADLLARFPYSAHPRNVALVLALARELEIPWDVALKEMADHVIPDLGVLKEFGPIAHQGRNISFINGMSANERAGFLSNWARMSLSSYGPEAGLEDWLCVVVNNRADRPARQAAFIEIALLDVMADSLAVIGTNVDVFAHEWQQGLRRVLRPRLLGLVREDTLEERKALVEEVARRLRRVPQTPEEAYTRLMQRPGAEAERLQSIIVRLWHPDSGGEWVEPEDPDDPVHQWLCEVGWLHRLRQNLHAWSPETVLEVLCQRLARRLVPLRNPASSGDQINETLLSVSPPDSRVRLLGCCNIKGTGLDFVYRWVSIERVMAWTALLDVSRPERMREGISSLRRHRDFGLFDIAHALAHIKQLLDSGALDRSEFQDEVRSLRTHLGDLQQALEERFTKSTKGRSGFSRAVHNVVDPIQSIARHNQVSQLMKDLGDGRVGLRRAATELRTMIDGAKG